MYQVVELCPESEDHEGDPGLQWHILHCQGSHPALHEHLAERAEQRGVTVHRCAHHHKVKSIKTACIISFLPNYFRHINTGLEQSIALLGIQPRYKTQEENFDLVLQCWLHLCYLLVTLACTYQVFLALGGWIEGSKKSVDSGASYYHIHVNCSNSQFVFYQKGLERCQQFLV